MGNPNVLHLTVEHFQTDHESTMQCLLRFLGHDRDWELVKKLRQLNPAAERNRRSRHMTHIRGNRSKASHLLKAIVFNATRDFGWVPDVSEVRARVSDAFIRQMNTFGCPHP